MTRIATRDLLLLLGITIVWGLNLVISKLGLESLSPLLFTTLRFAITALVLAPFLRLYAGQMSAIVIAGLLSGAVCFALMFVGLALAENVASVAIAGQLGVPFTTLLSVALLGEVVHWRRWTGIALSFMGVLVMGLDPRVFQYWPSLAFVIGSAFVGALGLIAVKRLRAVDPLAMQGWFALLSLPFLAALTLALERPTLQTVQTAPLEAWGAVLFSALGASVIAHTGFYYLVQRYPVTSVAPLTVLSPVLSVAFGIWWLGDTLTARIALGGALTLIGVFIIVWRERRIADTGT
jgi:O-acetylserine/cysteine efflux transporter